MFIYTSLENTSIEKLHKTFLEAFSDYEVKLDLPKLKFKQMLQRRGYIAKYSMGAFDKDELVGFLLNGVRNWNGKKTAYDTGTGVIENYRKQGITSNMFLNTKQLLEEMAVEQYLLEVIESNTSAIQLYKKQGFNVSREFDCFKLDKNKYKPVARYNVEHLHSINQGNWNELMKFWDFKPAWQNSIDSINSVADSFIYSVVIIKDAIVGYGIIDKKTGDIPQIAVDKNHRGLGIGRSIVTDLIKSTEAEGLSMLNIDSKCNSMKAFLMNLGFEYYVSQYEMTLSVRGQTPGNNL
jgi:ribosomal protein S18 acetylase RimI-like enzyme